MGFAVSPGLNVPPWLVDATQFSDLLARLQSALERPPSFSGALNPSLLAYDRASIQGSIAAVADSAQHTHVELRQALTSFATATIDRAHQARLIPPSPWTILPLRASESAGGERLRWLRSTQVVSASRLCRCTPPGKKREKATLYTRMRRRTDSSRTCRLSLHQGAVTKSLLPAI